MTGAVFFETCATFFKARFGGDELELPVQRDDSGQITASCRAQVIAAVGGFLSKHGIRPGASALCAIDGRGVSLRRLSVPVAQKEELQRLLRLQLEREFPVPPDQLAWGSRVLRQDAAVHEDGVADLLPPSAR